MLFVEASGKSRFPWWCVCVCGQKVWVTWVETSYDPSHRNTNTHTHTRSFLLLHSLSLAIFTFFFSLWISFFCILSSLSRALSPSLSLSLFVLVSLTRRKCYSIANIEHFFFLMINSSWMSVSDYIVWYLGHDCEHSAKVTLFSVFKSDTCSI